MRSHVSGDKELCLAVSYLLVKCEAYTWNKLKNTCGQICLDGSDYEIEIKLDDDKKIFAFGHYVPSLCYTFIKCIEFLLLSTITDRLSDYISFEETGGHGREIIDELVAEIQKNRYYKST